jgi:uncharacterized membrane protein
VTKVTAMMLWRSDARVVSMAIDEVTAFTYTSPRKHPMMMMMMMEKKTREQQIKVFN